MQIDGAAYVQRPAHQVPWALGLAIVVGCAAMLGLGVEPILVGALADGGRLGAAGVGQAGMLELIGVAAGAAIGSAWMSTGGIRRKTALAGILLVAANLLIFAARTPALVLLDRAVAGLLAGLLLGSVNLILTYSKTPDRLVGLLVGLSMIPQIAAAYLMPVFLIPRFGGEAGFALLAIGGLVALGCSAALVDRVETRAPSALAPRWGLSRPLVILALAVLVQNSALGGAWMYAERLAHQRGFGPEVVGFAIAGCLAFQLVGVWLAAWLAPRLPAWPVLLAGVLLQTLFLGLLILSSSPAAFIVWLCGLGLVWPAMQPFQVTEFIALDPTRRTAVCCGPLILVGNGLGPFLVSFGVRSDDVRLGFLIAAAMMAGAVLLYFQAAASRRRRGAIEGAARLLPTDPI